MANVNIEGLRQRTVLRGKIGCLSPVMDEAAEYLEGMLNEFVKDKVYNSHDEQVGWTFETERFMALKSTLSDEWFFDYVLTEEDDSQIYIDAQVEDNLLDEAAKIFEVRFKIHETDLRIIQYNVMVDRVDLVTWPDPDIMRNLDGIYFRVAREGGYDNVCFTDLAEDEQKKMLQGRSLGWLASMAEALVNCLDTVSSVLPDTTEEAVRQSIADTIETMNAEIKTVRDTLTMKGYIMSVAKLIRNMGDLLNIVGEAPEEKDVNS